MMIQSSTAAKLCQVTKQRFHQLAKLLKLREQGVRRGRRGQPERCWSLAQVSGMILLPQLVRLGVGEEAAARFCRSFASSSDESLEHTILHGRRWVVVAGSGIVPDVVAREQAEQALLKWTKQLAELGVTPVIVDVGTGFRELLAAVRAETTERTSATVAV